MDLSKIVEKRADSARYMVDEITETIKKYGKRAPGSKGEKEAIKHMERECKKYGCDKTTIEAFDFHPTAFMGWIYITVSLVLASLLIFLIGVGVGATVVTSIIALVFIALGVAAMLGEFIFYRKVVDKMYPKETSYNLTATKSPTGTVTKRIFFNGHPDAANEWPVNYYFGGRGFAMHFLVAIFGLVYFVAVVIASFFISKQVALIIGGISFVFVPFWIGMYFLWNEKIVVDGANDNLTGCYMGIAVLKALHEMGIELEHTEVGVLISGSEEAGLRGAKAWCETHKYDYKDAETVIISYDTIRESKHLNVNVKDLNSTVNADPELSAIFKAAADKLGIQCTYGSVPFGATDSAAFNQGGFRAIGITAMDHNLKNYYHTRKDSYDNLDEDCLADCFAITVETLKAFDEK